MKQVYPASKWWAFGIIILGCMFIIDAAVSSVESVIFSERAEPVNGVITDVSISHHRNDDDSFYDYYDVGADVQYTVDGVERILYISGYNRVRSGKPKRSEYIDDTVKIYYDPLNPSHARSTNEVNIQYEEFVTGIAIIIWGIFKLFKHKDYNRIWRDGIAVDARVVYMGVRRVSSDYPDYEDRPTVTGIWNRDDSICERQLDDVAPIACLEFNDPISGEVRDFDIPYSVRNPIHIGDSVTICLDDRDMTRFIIMP